MIDLPVGIVDLPLDTSPDHHPSTGTAAEIRVRVLLFSVLRDTVGASEIDLQLPAPARSEDVLDWLAIEHPAIRSYGSVTRVAVNHVYAPPHTELNDGDEVALITPVSGG